MINWGFDPNDINEDFALIPAGDHRVRIANVEEKVSKSGNDMLKITLDVSGQGGKLFYYLVFMPDNTTMTNTNLKRLWDSFGIESGNLNTHTWVGKVGAARVKHEDYNGEAQARLSYFIARNKQDALPAWQGGSAPVGFTEIPNASVPFDMGDLLQ